MARLALALLPLALAACAPEYAVDEVRETPTDAPLEASGTAKLQGYVRTTDGEPVPDARVTVGARKTTTNGKGFFTLHDLPSGEVIVHAEADGFSTTSRTRALVAETWAYVGLHLAPAELLSWDPALGGALQTADGVEITLPEEGLRDADGAPVTEPVTVAVTLLNARQTISAAPGALMADRDGQVALLKSLGMIEVRIQDADGLPAQIAAPATISFPLADEEDAQNPAGYGLFGFDEASGRWQEAGEGRLEGGRFQAEVPHFSWWNCDAFENDNQCATGTLVHLGRPIHNASITLEEGSTLTGGDFQTDEDGRFTIPLPTGEEVRLSMTYNRFSWQGESFTLPDFTVDDADRPEGCVDLGEIVLTDEDNDGDAYVGEAEGGPDCDDADAAVNPDARDAPYSGKDEDCGGEDDYDQDRDGYVSDADVGLSTTFAPQSGALPGGDCDDLDFYTNPSRIETCDGVDDNCSGDESDASDASDWFLDRDGDGYGADDGGQRACAAPGARWVAKGGDCQDQGLGASRVWPGAPEPCGDRTDYNCDGSVDDENQDGDAFLACEDCDDTNPSAYPGALEVCDDADNDCDGDADGDAIDRRTYAPDDDADGYGDASAVTTGCAVPEGFLEEEGDNLTDCDDRDTSRYPGAAEVCGDHLVQDCDGAVEEAEAQCPWSGAVDVSEADAIFVGEELDDEAGAAVAAAGDVNGDGTPDLAIGAYRQDAGAAEGGAAYLVLGPVSGTKDLSEADATFLGERAQDEAGRALSAARDMDGDGFDDLLIAAWRNSASAGDAGAAYLVLGPATGALELADADAKLLGEDQYDFAGIAVAGVGDTNGDGSPDLAIGAMKHGLTWGDAGAAYLVLGPLSGSLDLGLADAELSGEDANDYAGYALCAMGDVDGDGYEDLATGANANDEGGTYAGAVYLALGPVSGAVSLGDADGKLVGEAAGDRAGVAVSSAGDMDGDGLPDLVVGASSQDAGGDDAGAAYLVLGWREGTLSLSSADAKLSGEGVDHAAGSAVSGAGDVDADGQPDLAVGASGWSEIDRSEGAAYLVLGPVTGSRSLSDADLTLTGESWGGSAGSALAGAGDLDADGRADLLVGASGETIGGSSSGAAYLFLMAPRY